MDVARPDAARNGIPTGIDKYHGAGIPNPVAGVSRTFCHGYSISGQYLRDFVYQGFNEDEQGKRVCDGMMVHSAGGQAELLRRAGNA